jgi:phosphofructokinase-like protein
MLKKVAILANGGDVSGFNAVIRAIIKTAENKNIECYGFIDGFRGLLKNDIIKLGTSSTGNAVGILPKGGSIIGSSTNANVFNYPVEENGETVYKDLSDICVENIKKDEIDCLFTLGGDGTQKSARDLSLKGINVIGVPKTIDNDVACTEITFGYNTAVSVATEAIDRLHSTGETHHRIMVLEVMGRYAGWIALESAIAGGADVALIPEIPYDIESAARKVINRKNRGKSFSVVVVAEGAKPIGGEIHVKNMRNNGSGVDNTKLGGIGEQVAKQLEELTGLEARCTVLGYMQRGGTPTAYDRVLSTKYGTKAMELALEGKFNVLTVIKDGKLNSVPLEEVVGNNTKIGAVSGNTPESNLRKVTMDDELVKTARAIGINLGD